MSEPLLNLSPGAEETYRKRKKSGCLQCIPNHFPKLPFWDCHSNLYIFAFFLMFAILNCIEDHLIHLRVIFFQIFEKNYMEVAGTMIVR